MIKINDILDDKNQKMVNLIPKTLFPSVIFGGKRSSMFLSTIEGKKIMVVISRAVADKHAESIKKSLAKNKVFLFPLGREPTMEDHKKLVDEFYLKECNCVIGFGGGSVMDLAKTIKLENHCELILIATTFGSGSESSQFSLLTEEDEKKIMASYRMVPEIVVLDPAYLLTLSEEVIAYSCIDALSHALEGLASRASKSLTDAFATKAIDIIFSNAILAFEKKDAIALENLQVAGFLAGVVQSSSSVGLVHALAHHFGPRLGIGHGKAIAMWLIDVLKLNKANSEVYKKLDNCKNINSENFIDKISELYSKLGINLEELRKNVKVDEKTAEVIKNDICTRTNPFIPKVEDIEKILNGN